MADMLGPYPLNSIITGDARELAKAIPDESVDLIFTDPPYAKEYLSLYEWLGFTGQRILKSGGNLLVYAGSAMLDEIFALMRPSGLNWCYSLVIHHQGRVHRYWPLRLFEWHKLILWWSKDSPKLDNRFKKSACYDLQEKGFHEWQQGARAAEYWIDNFSRRDEIVVDFFAGCGTFPILCKTLGRRFLAFEINPTTAELAKKRIKNIQYRPLLPILQAEQLQMMGTKSNDS